MFEELKEKLKSLGTSPIFFIGSGLSRRYIKSPDWLGLLEETMNSTGVNFSRYEQKYTYRNEILNKDEIDLEALAQELEDVYFDKMPEEKLEKGGNKGYYYRKKVCEVISEYLENNKEDMLENEEVIQLKKTSPSAIITTNYDEMLEEIFGDEYTTHVGQTSLLTSIVDGVGDIYKIHGSVKEPNSIVITKDDYDRFFNKDIYLNAKILTLFLEYPIVFLGYSISDRNVKSILTTIVKMLPYEKVEELKSRIWFIKRAENEVDIEGVERIQLDDGLYIDIKSYELNNYGDFYKAINDTSIKKLPIRFLKYLKNNVYELVASQEYNPRLIDVNINDIEGIKNFNEGNNFVGLTFSTNEKKVFSSVSEIINAFIEGDNSYDPISVLGVVNEIYNKPIPFYKFIVSLNVKDVLKEIVKRFGKTSRIYQKIIRDVTSYKVNLGSRKEGIEFYDEISKEKVNKYLNKYKIENGFYKNHENVIRRYFMLYILNNRIEDLISNRSFICEFKEEITKAATNLSEEYINLNHSKILELVNILYNDNNTTEFKKLLCLVDRSIYRNKIKNIEELKNDDVEL